MGYRKRKEITMGYRSDVAIAIRFNEGAEFEYITFKEKLLSEMQALGYKNEDVGFSDTKMMMFFQADDVKWYENYPDVAMIDRAWDRAREVHESIGKDVEGLYLRLGENHDDLEERYFGNDPWDLTQYVQFVRHLNINPPDGIEYPSLDARQEEDMWVEHEENLRKEAA